MRPLIELIDAHDPALPLLREWVQHADVPCEILPPSERRAHVLHTLQVTTRSPLGAIAYETGGLLIHHGWLRILGSGHPRLTRDIAAWNAGRSNRFFLVADDAAGGFFAINGGLLGPNPGNVYYWPPDSLDWQDLALGYTDFLRACLTSRLDAFYNALRWPGWKEDVSALPANQCFAFYPFLWTTQGSSTTSHRSPVPIAEAYKFKRDALRQLQK